MKAMNCNQVRRQLDLLALGDLPESVRAEVAAHLETCPECRQAWQNCRMVVASIRSSACPVRPRPAFLIATRSAVRAEVRSARRRRRLRRTVAAVVSAAATLLLAAAVWHVAGSRPEGTADSPTTRAAAAEQWRLEGAIAVPTSAGGGVIARSRRMYFVRRNETGNSIVAVSAATGHPIWQARPDSCGYLAADEARVYCLAYGSGRTVDLIALDSATGNLLWRYSPGAARSLEGPCKPVPLAPDRVCWTAGHAVHMLDASTGRALWTFSLSGEGRLSIAQAFGNEVYAAGAAALHCLGDDSGRSIWRQPLGVGKTGPMRPLLAVGGRRGYVAYPTLGQTSRLVCLDLDARRVLWRRAIPRPRHLLATEDTLYVRGRQVLALDGASGTPRWTRPASGCSPLTADENLVHLVDSTDAGRLVALDRHTGHQAWEIPGIRSCDAFVQAGDLGLIKTADGVVHAFALRTP